MRPIAFTIALIGVLVLSYTVHSFAADEACTLITQTQVSAALEVPVGAGTPISRPGTCQWVGKGRIATLTFKQPLGGKSPLEQFNAGKTSTMPGITAEPVSGVGDDAFYIYFSNTTRALGLVVRKGGSVYEIRVYGFEIDKAKSVAKTLCQIVAGKI